MSIKQTYHVGNSIMERTVTPLEDLRIRPISVKNIQTFEHSRDLMTLMLGAIRAHSDYYYAGVLHGNVAVETLVIVEDPLALDPDLLRKGALVDLDKGLSFRRPERPLPFGARNK